MQIESAATTEELRPPPVGIGLAR